MASKNVVRELLVLLGVKVSPGARRELESFENALNHAKLSAGQLADNALRAGRNLALMALGGAAALGKLTVDAGLAAVEIERQARLLLLSRQEYQEWLHVSQRAGATSRDLADTFLQINDASQRAIGGSKEMTEAFRSLGISTKQLKGQNPGQLMELLAEQIEKTTDKSKALGVVSRLLGEESGRKFGPLLLSGADAIRAMRREAEALGIVMSDKQLSSLKAVSEQWRILTTRARGLRNVLAAALAPAIERLLKRLDQWLAANRELAASRIDLWVERVTILVTNLDRAVGLIGGWDTVLLGVATGAGMLLLIANLDKAVALVSALRAGWALLGLAAGALGISLSPVLLVLVTIAAAVLAFLTAVMLLGLAIEDLWVFLQGGNSVLGDNLDLLESIIPGFGAFRDLVWALVTAFVQAVTNVGRFVDAIRQGLKPALELVEDLLVRLLGRFADLRFAWQALDELASRPLRALTDSVQGVSAGSTALSGAAANQLQGALANQVSGQLPGMRASSQSIDQSVGGTVNQFNTIMGADGDAIGDALGRAVNVARVATQGGRR